MKRNLLLLSGTMILCLIAGEVALRAMGFGNPLRFEYDDQLLWRMVPDQEAYAPNYGVSYVINAGGWRDDELPVARPEGEVRVLALGDSVLFGQGVPDEQTLARRLEKRLAERHEAPVNVINTGVPGYNVMQYRRLLENGGLAYEPAWVLLTFVKNDIVSRAGIEAVRTYAREGQVFEMRTFWGWARSASAWLHVAHGLWTRLMAYGRPPPRALAFADGDADEQGWPYVMLELDRIVQVTRDRGIPLIIVVFPYRDEAESDRVEAGTERLAAFAAERGIDLIELQPVFARRAAEQLFLDVVHPNALGHEVAAEAILERLPALGL
jgi:lysophospholipase L1-like esterase